MTKEFELLNFWKRLFRPVFFFDILLVLIILIVSLTIEMSPDKYWVHFSLIAGTGTLFVTNLYQHINWTKNKLIKLICTENGLGMTYVRFNKSISISSSWKDVEIREKASNTIPSMPFLLFSVKNKSKIKIYASTYRDFGEEEMSKLISLIKTEYSTN